MVIRYAFLWSHEAARGADEGRKERPCSVVVSARQRGGTESRVIVAPITHEPPTNPDDGIALPGEVKRRLGLDPAPQWLRFEELNRFS